MAQTELVCKKCLLEVDLKDVKSHKCEQARLDCFDLLFPNTPLAVKHEIAQRNGVILLAYHRGFQAGRESRQ